MKECFGPARILLPDEEIPVEQWACLACDQFTSQPEYWQRAEALVREKPSALHIVLPEIYLGEADLPQRIEQIHRAMEEYAEKYLTRQVEGFVYLERDLGGGCVRQGLVGMVDLEAYDYNPGSSTPIRPTENTVVERIPPRLAVRRDALLESPHVMMLVDDEEHSLIEPLAACKAGLRPLYSGRLMLDGGSVRGWAVESEEHCRRIQTVLAQLGSAQRFDRKYPQASGQPPLTLAVGDGNHSLATAKAWWEEIKPTLSEQEREDHPARFCLVEVCNVHSPAITVEPIHRVLFGAGGRDFLEGFKALCREEGLELRLGDAAANCPQQAVLNWGEGEVLLGFAAPREPLTVGTVEHLLGLCLAKGLGSRVDYIHGSVAARNLAREGAVAFLLPAFDKSDLFRGVVLGGVLPRKTFSMGHATEKRYYLECRRIRP